MHLRALAVALASTCAQPPDPSAGETTTGHALMNMPEEPWPSPAPARAGERDGALTEREALRAELRARRPGGEAEELSPEAVAALRRAAELLRGRPALRMTIRGHCDVREGRSDGERRALGRARAEAARAFLVDVEGIDPARLEVEAVGADEPIDTSATAAGRAKNRRIELTVASP
jgi:outer membrane protein OmpA-like peptidoglycan-associated protein